MKHFLLFICCFALLATSAFADTKSSFVNTNSDFHKLDIGELEKDKTSQECISCHLMDKKLNSIPIQNIDDTNGQPDSYSRACLVCHDGNEASLVLNAPISPCGLKNKTPVGKSGANHPVFMKYNYKNDLHAPSSTLNGNWKDAKVVGDLLRDDKMVCISCHIPHHTTDEGFIRTSTKGSALCLGCHLK